MLNIAVFVSGRGSNLKAILDSQKLQDLIRVTAVISNKIDCPAFEIAKENSINTFHVGKGEGAIQYSELAVFLTSLEIDLIVLAGFLKMIPSNVTDAFRNRIINIHPALLPAFGGKGMYGMNVHRAVFDSSAKESGATVHFVNEVYDDGEIIAQRKVDISDLTSPEAIAERVLKVEHELLPDVIEQYALRDKSLYNKKIEFHN